MTLTIRLHSAEWTRAIVQLQAATKRAQADIVNQAVVDTAAYAFDALPPRDVNTSRKSLRAMLTEQLAQKVRLAERGKRAGQYIPVGSKFFTNPRSKGKDRQLRRIHLIVNKAMGRRGKKGLWGSDMRRYVGSVVGRRTRGVGFLKSVFVPIFVTMNRLVKYKFPVGKTRNIARWPGSAAHGYVNPARIGENPLATFTVAPKLHGVKSDSKVMQMYYHAIGFGIATKAAKMLTEAQRALARIAAGHNGRRI